MFCDSFFTARRSNRRAKDSIVEEERDKLGKEGGVIEFREPSLRGRTKERVIFIAGFVSAITFADRLRMFLTIVDTPRLVETLTFACLDFESPEDIVTSSRSSSETVRGSVWARSPSPTLSTQLTSTLRNTSLESTSIFFDGIVSESQGAAIAAPVPTFET